MLREEVEITVVVDPELRTQFTQAALKSNRSADEALRDFMRDFVAQARELGQLREPLSAAERRQRQEAVDASRATVRLEGFTTSEERETAARKYVAGELDLDGFLRGMAVPERVAVVDVLYSPPDVLKFPLAATTVRER